jgi:signal peptidase II
MSQSIAPQSDTPNKWKRAWCVLIVTALLGLTTDLLSKWASFRWLGDTPVEVTREAVLDAIAHGRMPGDTLPRPVPVRTVIPHVLDLTLVLNPGAVFGLGAGRRLFFVVFTMIALAFALAIFRRWTTPHDTMSHAGLGLIIAGGLGNLYDRLIYGCVRDFLHPLPNVYLPLGWEWPWGGREVWPYVSNLADLWLILGIASLIWRSFRPINHVA